MGLSRGIGGAPQTYPSFPEKVRFGFFPNIHLKTSIPFNQQTNNNEYLFLSGNECASLDMELSLKMNYYSFTENHHITVFRWNPLLFKRAKRLLVYYNVLVYYTKKNGEFLGKFADTIGQAWTLNEKAYSINHTHFWFDFICHFKMSVHFFIIPRFIIPKALYFFLSFFL